MEFKRRQGLKPDCKKCRVELLPENNVIDYLMYKYGGIMIDGMGSISAEGIRLAVEIEDIEDRALVTYKLVTYLRAALDSQNKEHTNGESNKD